MLNRLHIRNFTVFAEANFEFGPGLNVIVGTNGTGKSHVLKLGYAMTSKMIDLIGYSIVQNSFYKLSSHYKNYHDGKYMFIFHDKIKSIFQSYPSQRALDDLVRHNTDDFTPEIKATTTYRNSIHKFECSINLTQVKPPEPEFTWAEDDDKDMSLIQPVFIPAKEVLTLGWLLSLYDRREIPIDETYPDLLRLLSGPPLKSLEPVHIVERLRKLIGGKVEEEGGHFYLSTPDQPRMEMNLVAEGMRKFATLYKLLANGTLTPETTLFWDEPEANLNPALLKEMAAVLAEMARAGFQIILATHSLFLLKELHILSQREKLPVRYFGLSAQNGEATQVATADTLTDLPNLVALEVEMAQSDDFLNVLNQEDANR